MGQPVHILLFHEDEAAGLGAAHAALAELWRVEARLTLFDSASDLSELNRRAGTAAMLVDQDLAAVLAAAVEFRRATGGAFNVAVEPLMRAWGFRESRKTPPGLQELAAARAAVQAAVVRVDGNRAALPVAHTAIDLGGIGVGYGLDRAGVILRSRGVGAALIDVSGDLLAIGAPPGQPGWPIDIVDSRSDGTVIATTILRDQALATSANTRSVVHFGRLVRGHVMDPATGAPADRRIQSTVVATAAIAADALATAALVLGQSPPGVLATWLL
jgi:thiamine biosynthesis lipoprotein